MVTGQVIRAVVTSPLQRLTVTDVDMSDVVDTLVSGVAVCGLSD